MKSYCIYDAQMKDHLVNLYQLPETCTNENEFEKFDKIGYGND